jgi:hypothetical protein
MKHLPRKLWDDDRGAWIATEWVFVATTLVLGAVIGLVAVRQAVASELTDFTNAVLSLNQSYSSSGQSNCQTPTADSQFSDSADSVPANRTPAGASAADQHASD